MSDAIYQSVYQGIVERIASGMYPAGSLLPSCRVLSQELGVNKNTVSKVFKMLQEKDFIRCIPGVGTKVTGKAVPADASGDAEVLQSLDRLLNHARLRGIPRERLDSLYRFAASRCYSKERLRAALIECNKWDAASLSDHVQQHLPVTVTPVLIDDFVQSPQSHAGQYHLLLTTFYHYSDLLASVPDSLRERLIAIQDKPSIDSLLKISRIPVNKRIGLAAGHVRTLNLIEATLEACGHHAVAKTVVTETSSVRQMLRSVDLVVSSVRCVGDLAAYTPQVPVIAMDFEVDSQSIDFLKRRVHDIMLKRDTDVQDDAILCQLCPMY